MTRGRISPGRWDVLLVIAIGGALGSLGRWWLSDVMPVASGQIPRATWIENVSGAFALGLLMVFVLDVWPPNRYARPFLGVGVLGGYTTFSTYMLDTHALLRTGEGAAAALYMAGTLITGLFAVAAGIVLARFVARGLATRSERRRNTPVSSRECG